MGRWLIAATLAASWLVGGQSEDPGGRIELDSARQVVEEVRVEVARLRGLEFKQEVPVRVVGRDEAREHFLARLEKFDLGTQLAQAGKAYALLGLIPDDVAIVDLLLGTVADQAGGYYDPGTRSYYLLSHIPPPAIPVFTAHELTHALEDQHWDLDARLRSVLDNDDELFALGALHEGSATLLMMAYMGQAMMKGDLDAEALAVLGEAESEQWQRMAELPPVLVRQIVGPYVLGSQFLSYGRQALSYPAEAVDRAYREPPVSSEQILHPDKYWKKEERDPPRQVDLSGVGSLLGKRWERRGGGVLGELILAVLVEPSRDEGPSGSLLISTDGYSNDAAAGWGGDRWELWHDGHADVLLLSTVWDTDEDAREFAAAVPASKRIRWKRTGARVAIVAGDAGRKTARVLGAMLPTEAD